MKLLILFLFLLCTIPEYATTAKCTADSAKAHINGGYGVFSVFDFGENL